MVQQHWNKIKYILIFMTIFCGLILWGLWGIWQVKHEVAWISIFDDWETRKLRLTIETEAYKKAVTSYDQDNLPLNADIFFPGAKLSFDFDGHRWTCEGVLWRPGGQSKRMIPRIQRSSQITAVSYKLKLPERCLGLKKLKLEYFEDASSLAQNIAVKDLYEREWLLTPRIVAGEVTVRIGDALSRGNYSLDESLDDDFLTRVIGEEGSKWWLFRVNTLWNRAGFLTPIAQSEMDSLIWIEPDDGSRRFVYDLKTNKKRFTEWREKLLNFINALQTVQQGKISLADTIYTPDVVKLTAINKLIGNYDDYATQGNNYYLFFPENGWPARMFGVDFDRIRLTDSPRNFMLSNTIHPLYDRVTQDPETATLYNKTWQDMITRGAWIE